MKWINASKRLPELPGRYFIKIENVFKRTCDFYDGQFRYEKEPDDYSKNQIEWLDDTESSHPCKDVQEAAKELFKATDWMIAEIEHLNKHGQDEGVSTQLAFAKEDIDKFKDTWQSSQGGDAVEQLTRERDKAAREWQKLQKENEDLNEQIRLMQMRIEGTGNEY